MKKKLLKKSHNAKKLKEGRGPFGIFHHPFCRKTQFCQKKLKRDPLGKQFTKKISQCRKTEKGPFSLLRYCMLRGKPFWFSSLGQRKQFGVFLKFC